MASGNVYARQTRVLGDTLGPQWTGISVGARSGTENQMVPSGSDSVRSKHHITLDDVRNLCPRQRTECSRDARLV
jgi:hypothetical protein